MALVVRCKCGAQYEWPWINKNPPACFNCGRNWTKEELPPLGGDWEDDDGSEDPS